jgi:hypothetical protein
VVFRIKENVYIFLFSNYTEPSTLYIFVTLVSGVFQTQSGIFNVIHRGIYIFNRQLLMSARMTQPYLHIYIYRNSSTSAILCIIALLSVVWYISDQNVGKLYIAWYRCYQKARRRVRVHQFEARTIVFHKPVLWGFRFSSRLNWGMFWTKKNYHCTGSINTSEFRK